MITQGCQLASLEEILNEEYSLDYNLPQGPVILRSQSNASTLSDAGSSHSVSRRGAAQIPSLAPFFLCACSQLGHALFLQAGSPKILHPLWEPITRGQHPAEPCMHEICKSTASARCNAMLSFGGDAVFLLHCACHNQSQCSSHDAILSRCCHRGTILSSSSACLSKSQPISTYFTLSIVHRGCMCARSGVAHCSASAAPNAQRSARSVPGSDSRQIWPCQIWPC